MSSNVKAETSHPALWTAAIVGFVAITVFWFAHWYNRGELIGREHEKPAPAPTEAEPDHAALIAKLDKSVVAAGKAIYGQNCASCHGPKGMAGVNGARKFPAEAMLNGAGPYEMYLTLKNGYNLMPSQPGLSPEEKYEVIHYIRETFLKEKNASQYIAFDDEYIAAASWPAAGSGGDAGDRPHPKTQDLTVPVMAVSQRYVDANAHDANSFVALIHAASLSEDIEVAFLSATRDGKSTIAGSILAALNKENGSDLIQQILVGGDQVLHPRFGVMSSVELKQTVAALVKTVGAPAIKPDGHTDHGHGESDHSDHDHAH